MNESGEKSCCDIFTLSTLVASAVTVAGSLWLSLGMGLKPCPLCYYQRTFAMATFALVAASLYTRGVNRWLMGALTLPLVSGGTGVALWHVYLEMNHKLECPLGIGGIGTAPQQSLAAFAVVLLCSLGCLVTGKKDPAAKPVCCAGIVGVLLGGVLAFGAVRSVAPSKPPAPEEYEKAPDICRPPKPAA